MENFQWNTCINGVAQQVTQYTNTASSWIRRQYIRGRHQFHRRAKQTRSFRGNSGSSTTSILSTGTNTTTTSARISKHAQNFFSLLSLFSCLQ